MRAYMRACVRREKRVKLLLNKGLAFLPYPINTSFPSYLLKTVLPHQKPKSSSSVLGIIPKCVLLLQSLGEVWMGLPFFPEKSGANHISRNEPSVSASGIVCLSPLIIFLSCCLWVRNPHRNYTNLFDCEFVLLFLRARFTIFTHVLMGKAERNNELCSQSVLLLSPWRHFHFHSFAKNLYFSTLSSGLQFKSSPLFKALQSPLSEIQECDPILL